MAEGVPAADLQQYFKDARSWDHDRALSAAKERRMAYRVAAAALAVAAGTLVWHVAAPLKTVEPYVIRVNQASGGVDVVTAVNKTKELTGDEAVRKFFLSQYVRNRESWVADGATEMFNAVAAQSIRNEQEKFAGERKPENPDSPVNRFRNGETVGVRVTNVAFINDRVAQVHFERIVRAPGLGGDVKSNWISTINFKFVDKPESEADRLYNPLGFQVISYRADPEIGR